MRIFISSVQKEFAAERKAMYMRGYIEHVGSGTGDIIEKCRDRGLPAPLWENEDDGFTLTIRRPSAQKTAQEATVETTIETTTETTIETATETTIENLSDGARKVREAILRNPAATLDQIAEAVSMTRDGVFYHVKALRRDLGLRHKGPTKKGRWVFDVVATKNDAAKAKKGKSAK